MGLALKNSDLNISNSSTKPTDVDQNYDAQSDDHNIIIGSLALLLALLTIVIALLQYRLDRRRNHVAESAANPETSPTSMELADLGML